MLKPSKPTVYIVFRYRVGNNTNTKFAGFIRKIKKLGVLPDAKYVSVALDDMIFVVDKAGDAKIFNYDGAQILHDAAFVYFKTWEKMPEQAGAVASYLYAKGIPFEDQIVKHQGLGKLPMAYRLWGAGLPVIPTLVSKEMPKQDFVKEQLGKGPYLLKPASGEKGRGIVYCAGYSDAWAASKGYDKQWMLQTFIPNKGDYRVFAYGYVARGALFRRAQAGSIVNNTTQGAESDYISQEDLDPMVADIARRATKATGNAVAGVDIMPDKNGKLYLLEVNQGSQIVTGHSREEKMTAFGDFMHESVADRMMRDKTPNHLTVIGRRATVNLPEFGIKKIVAKVDSGAYVSAIHATNIHEKTIDGEKVLEFTLLDGHNRASSSKTCQAHEYNVVRIKSSSGAYSTRYKIKTPLSVNGRMMKTSLTLADRADMNYPLLLGRRFLRGRYMVNVELSEPKGENQK